MSQITGSFPVTAGGINVGHVKIEQNGLMTVFDCTCNYKSHEVLRLAAVCSGNYVPLGVMVPEKTTLRLTKSFSKNALSSLGYTETATFHLIKPGDVYTAFEESRQSPEIIETPAELPQEPLHEPTILESSPGDIMTDDAPVLAAVEIADEEVLPAVETEPIVYNDFPEPTEYVYEFEPSPKIHAYHLEHVNTTPESAYETPASKEPDKEAGQQTEMDARPADTASTVPTGWTFISNPRILFNDSSVQEACEGVSGAYITEQDDCVLLAVPVLPNEPFPMMPVFCFGYSGEIGGQEYIVFKIRNGNLTL